ncbi:hypothetical protein [Marmot herpesvirus 1]|nr:hypothetical protein [Marmot herpesvirus 1]
MCQGDSGRFNVPVNQRCRESKIHLDDVMLLHTFCWVGYSVKVRICGKWVWRYIVTVSFDYWVLCCVYQSGL